MVSEPVMRFLPSSAGTIASLGAIFIVTGILFMLLGFIELSTGMGILDWLKRL